MPTIEWLKEEFHYGYSSGDILNQEKDLQRESEERKIGGLYKDVIEKLLKVYIKPEFNVLELGPGRGSWSNVILNILNEKGNFNTLDFQDVSQWIDPDGYSAKVKHFRVDSLDYSFLDDDYYDLFWSFGVLCHNNIDSIYQIIHNIYPKMKKGSILIHQYADWEKLESYGWENGAIPMNFKNKRDDQIWWPRNNKKIMQTILEANGFEVVEIDCNIVKRDSICISIKK